MHVVFIAYVCFDVDVMLCSRRYSNPCEFTGETLVKIQKRVLKNSLLLLFVFWKVNIIFSLKGKKYISPKIEIQSKTD